MGWAIVILVVWFWFVPDLVKYLVRWWGNLQKEIAGK